VSVKSAINAIIGNESPLLKLQITTSDISSMAGTGHDLTLNAIKGNPAANNQPA